MLELLGVYALTIFCSILAALALSSLGFHAVARNKGLETLTISQFAALGILLGEVTLHGEGVFAEVFQLFLALLFGWSAVTIATHLGRNLPSGRSTLHLAAYVVGLAASYWLVSYFPKLEANMTASYFGDLVTVGGAELWLSVGVSLSVLVFIAMHYRALLAATFGEAVFWGADLTSVKRSRTFDLLGFCLIVVSIYSLGLLFTLSALLIPSVALAVRNKGTARSSMTWVLFISSVSTLVGVLLSLSFERFSTVPSVTLTMVFLSLIAVFLRR